MRGRTPIIVPELSSIAPRRERFFARAAGSAFDVHATDDRAEVVLYGEIGFDVTAATFKFEEQLDVALRNYNNDTHTNLRERIEVLYADRRRAEISEANDRRRSNSKPALLCTDAEAADIMLRFDRAIFNGVGERQVNVCGANGSIAVGDLIVTSAVPGKGMRQDDDVVRSYTVARARESVTMGLNDTAQIACFYVCG